LALREKAQGSGHFSVSFFQALPLVDSSKGFGVWEILGSFWKHDGFFKNLAQGKEDGAGMKRIIVAFVFLSGFFFADIGIEGFSPSQISCSKFYTLGIAYASDSGFCNTGHLIVRRTLFPHFKNDKEARAHIERIRECNVSGTGNRRTIETGYTVLKHPQKTIVRYRADVVKQGDTYILCGIYLGDGWEAQPENDMLKRQSACK